MAFFENQHLEKSEAREKTRDDHIFDPVVSQIMSSRFEFMDS